MWVRLRGLLLAGERRGGVFQERRAPRGCSLGDRNCVPPDQVVNLIYDKWHVNGGHYLAARKIGRWLTFADLARTQLVKVVRNNDNRNVGVSNGKDGPADTTCGSYLSSLFGTSEPMASDADPTSGYKKAAGGDHPDSSSSPKSTEKPISVDDDLDETTRTREGGPRSQVRGEAESVPVSSTREAEEEHRASGVTYTESVLYRRQFWNRMFAGSSNVSTATSSDGFFDLRSIPVSLKPLLDLDPEYPKILQRLMNGDEDLKPERDPAMRWVFRDFRRALEMVRTGAGPERGVRKNDETFKIFDPLDELSASIVDGFFSDPVGLAGEWGEELQKKVKAKASALKNQLKMAMLLVSTLEVFKTKRGGTSAEAKKNVGTVVKVSTVKDVESDGDLIDLIRSAFLDGADMEEVLRRSGRFFRFTET